MREILFRGKAKNDGEWLCGHYTEYAGVGQIWVDTDNGKHNYLVDIDTVGEYTGLNDQNGKRIFEGDIMPVWEGGEKYLYKVIYCGDCFMLSMLDSEQGSYPLSVKHSISEVIGNIHDNSELLEGGNDNAAD